MKKTPVSYYLNLFVCLLASHLCIAQGKLVGKIVDAQHQPLNNASVLLLKAKDSSLVMGLLTDINGIYSFNNIPFGPYIIASSYSGLKMNYTSQFLIENEKVIEIGVLRLTEQEVVLSDVTVSAKKPLFEQKIDRMVINVESCITSAGSTALDVLMRSPGITVNQQNNTLSLNGKEGVMVMLNGKLNRMPIEAMMQLLAGMSAANIEKIELITTPPANFDAEGNAGFINIVLKKNIQHGTNGSFSATTGYGLGVGPVLGSSINFNHRKEKWNFYGDNAFSRFEPNTHMEFYRMAYKGSSAIENRMRSDRDDFRRTHSGRIGIDYELNPKTILGVLVTGFSNMYSMDAVNYSSIYSSGILDTSIVINNPERHPLDNYSVNLNLFQSFTNQGQLSVNVDYIYYRDANKLTYLNNFYNNNENLLFSNQTKSSKETPINFWVATTDYTKKLGKKIDLETGLKATFSTFINDVSVEREKQNSWYIDKDFTSRHYLDESIFAAYTSLNLKLSEKTTSKAGLRYEYTNSNLDSETQKDIVDRHYGSLFPSLFLSHILSDKSSLNFSFSRRITRPTFNDMAPFVYFIDPNTSFSGNPALQPSIANALKWDYLYKRFVLSISYTHEKNSITNFSPTVDPVNNKQTLSAENQKGKDVVAITVSLPFTITKWWTMQNNISGYYQRLNAFYKGTSLNIEQRNFDINTSQSFKLPKDYTVELTGFYQSGGLFGIYKIGDMTSVNLGIQKKFGPKGGTLLLNVTDVTGPPHLKFFVDAPEHNLVSNGSIRFSVTTFKLTYIRKFGIQTVKGSRSRKTGSEEERQRVQ